MFSDFLNKIPDFIEIVNRPPRLLPTRRKARFQERRQVLIKGADTARQTICKNESMLIL